MYRPIAVSSNKKQPDNDARRLDPVSRHGKSWTSNLFPLPCRSRSYWRVAGLDLGEIEPPWLYIHLLASSWRGIDFYCPPAPRSKTLNREPAKHIHANWNPVPTNYDNAWAIGERSQSQEQLHSHIPCGDRWGWKYWLEPARIDKYQSTPAKPPDYSG